MQRQRLTKPLWDEFRQWLELQRPRVADGGAAAKAIDYTHRRWAAFTRHLQDGAVALNNNHLERQINSWAMGRKVWMFMGSELAGQRAADVMSLVQSARLNGHDPWAYQLNKRRVSAFDSSWPTERGLRLSARTWAEDCFRSPRKKARRSLSGSLSQWSLYSCLSETLPSHAPLRLPPAVGTA